MDYATSEIRSRYLKLTVALALLREGDIVKRGRKLNVDLYQSGSVATIEERYSFFRVLFREFGDGCVYCLSAHVSVYGAVQTSHRLTISR
jgi:hypothetical protein